MLTLHDHLYTGPLFPYLALNLPYIPHITIGKCPSPNDAKALCDELNSETISVTGTIDTVTVVVEIGDRVKEQEQFSLTTP